MSSIAISLHEAAVAANDRSARLSMQYNDPSLMLNMDQSYTLAAAIVADYITQKSKYPCNRHELEGTLCSLFPWWCNKPTHSCQAVIGEEVVLGGLKAGMIETITFKETFLGRDELNKVRFTGLYYDNVVSFVEEILHNTLKNYIPNPTWIVWFQRCLGDVVILEPGEDYRILDWERRMADGVWQ